MNYLLFSFAISLFSFIFIVGVVEANAQIDCLDKGFPKYVVTWNFDSYCISLDGVVITKVEKNE